jgi:hypothetical protein
VRRHVRKPTIGPDCLSASGHPQIPAIAIIVTATAVRLSEVDASGDALSAPITVNNSGIDARNGQAYHGRKTIATNMARPTPLGSRAGKEHPIFRERCKRFTPRARPCPGTAGCA